MNAELLKFSAEELMSLFKSKKLKPKEFFQIQLEFARKVDPLVKSFLYLAQDVPDPESYPTESDNVLFCVPVSIKDILCTRDMPTTAGSRILEGYVPPYDASAVKLLRKGGNFILGKTNLDEFAMGSSTENSGFFPTRNPWDPARVPGGSSGGGATSVASLQSVIALGTDTGGSVRQPASFCGVYGFRPTYGMISRYGLIAYASSLDQVGIFARTVADIAYTMNTISKPDTKDATCIAREDLDFVSAVNSPPDFKGARLGVVASLMNEKVIDEEVLTLCEESLRILAGYGVEIVSVELPFPDQLLPCYYILTSAEASSNLARYDGVRYGLGFAKAKNMNIQEQYLTVRSKGFGAEVKRRILLGTYVLSAGYAERYYNQARQVRKIVVDAVSNLLKEIDFLFAPTSPTVAFYLGERLDDPVKMWSSDVCVVLANLANLPSISVPAWTSREGLPVGIQFMGRRGDDSRLLAFARTYEQVSSLRFRVPPLIERELTSFRV